MRKAFSLVELIVVIAVIAVLSVIVLVGLSGLRNNSHDSRRLADLTQAQTDLELYFAACGFYPGPANCTGGFNQNTDTWAKLDSTLRGSASLNISGVPNDPTAGHVYFYGANASGTSYLVAAQMESSDTAAFQNYVPPSDFANYNAQGLTTCNKPFYCVEFLYSGVTPAPTTYNCVNNSCVSAGSGGAFSSLSACNAKCGSAVSQPPVITSQLTASGMVGAQFSYQITASNNPTSFDATGLPDGLTVDTASGLISGSPKSANKSNVTIKAANAGGTGTAVLVLTVEKAPDIGSIPSTFFAISDTDQNDPPTITYGAGGHPSPFVWTLVEDRTRDVYDWSVLDQFVRNAPKDSRGVAQITLTLGKTPAWAVADKSACAIKNGRDMCTVPPDNIQDWKNFITAFVQRYNGVSQPHVQYYEIWNEANSAGFWTGTQAQLVALAQVAYPIIHTDPYALVITPSTAPLGGAVPWYTTYLQEGGSLYADVGSFHGYQGAGTAESIAGRVDNYRRAMDANGMAGKPLINTEGSWGNNTNGYSWMIDPDQQTAYLARYMIVQAGLYTSDKFVQASWYTWGGGAPQTWGNIENADRSPTQAGNAYSQVYQWLVGTAMNPCSSSGTIWTCALRRSGGYQGLIVWDTSKTCSSGVCSTAPYNPGSSYTKYRLLSGSSVNISNNSVPVGLKPILLEN